MIHFFTIVLNGFPFIDKHIKTFLSLDIDWHWHIIEGVANLTHDTSWCLRNGGAIDSSFHSFGLSSDGTTEYLNRIKAEYPTKITIYRKTDGSFWDGKREMINAPLINIKEECILWQIDVDEFWTKQQISTSYEMFLSNPNVMAAYYWCHYFVGKNLLIATRNCYGNNPAQEWLRTWRYKPNFFWLAHEPPILVEKVNDRFLPIHKYSFFDHNFTNSLGLVFQHFAYCTENQLRFKETYYGYKNALENWKKLQQQEHFPQMLKNYFPWVSDYSVIEKTSALKVDPIIVW